MNKGREHWCGVGQKLLNDQIRMRKIHLIGSIRENNMASV